MSVNMPGFSGFPPSGLQFLADLAVHNNRAWFEAHKSDYQAYLLEPTQAFVRALGTRLQALASGIGVDTRTDGRGVLMRIYRDTRFSSDKSPYKTSLHGMFCEGREKKMESPGFGFQIDATGMELFTGMYKFPPPLLMAFRNRVIDEQHSSDLAHVCEVVTRAGEYIIEGERLKHVPPGYDSDNSYADFLRYDGLYAMSPRVPVEEIVDRSLVDLCFTHYQNMAPLYTWLKEALEIDPSPLL